MRTLLLMALAGAALAQDPYALVRHAVELELAGPQFPADFAFDKRVRRTDLDSQGLPRQTHVMDYECIVLLGETVERLVARDGQPLTGNEATREQAEFDRAFARAAALTPEKRQKVTAENIRRDLKRRDLLRDIPRHYELTLAGQELHNGRPAWRVDATPRKGADLPFGPQRTFFKLHGSIWIDVETGEWVKIDTLVTETLSWGLFLARIRPGSRIAFERNLLPDGTWVQTRFGGRFVARFFGLTKFALESETTFSNYRKFGSESRVEDVQELEPEGSTPPLSGP